MDAAAVGSAVKDYWEALAAAGAGGVAVWRYAVRPLVGGCRRISTALVSVEAMAAALGPNGGASLADKIGATHTLALDSSQALYGLEARVNELGQYVERPFFQADAHGKNTRVNVAMERLFGYESAELMGSGWEQVVAPEHRDRVRREWASAVAEKRNYITHAVYLTRQGVPLKVTVTAHPWINASTGAVLGWHGEIQPEEVLMERRTA